MLLLPVLTALAIGQAANAMVSSLTPHEFFVSADETLSRRHCYRSHLLSRQQQTPALVEQSVLGHE